MKNAKRFLTLLLVVVLSVSLVALAACGDDPDPTPDKGDTKTVSLTVKNGNFAAFSDVANDSAGVPQPGSPTNWTSVTGTSSSVKGVVDVSKWEKYGEKLASKDGLWLSAANPGKQKSSLTENLDADNNVLMVYNSEAGYAGYYCASGLSVSAGKEYVLHVSVKTDITSQTGGAKIYIYNSGAGYMEIADINTNGEWKDYTIRIIGNPTASKSLSVYLTLGYNEKAPASGWAFFDNVYLEDVSEKDTAVTADKSLDLAVPNPEFDYVTFQSKGGANTPAMYTSTNTGNGNNLYRRVDTSSEVFEAAKGGYGEGVVNPGVPDGTVGSHVYMLYNSELSAIGMRSTSTVNFAQCGLYEVSVWVKTNISSDPAANCTAALKLVDGKTEYVLDGINTNGEWQLCTFYVIASKNGNNSLDFEFHFGTGKAEDGVKPATFSKGWAFFDGLTYKKVASEDEFVDEAGVSKIVNLRIDENSTLENGYFNDSNPVKGISVITDEDSDLIGGTDVSGVKAGVIDLSSSDKNITLLDGTVEAYAESVTVPALPYVNTKVANSNRLFAVLPSSPCIYKFKFADAKMVLAANDYYRIGAWVKTQNFGDASVTVKLMNAEDDSVLATSSGIDSDDITSGAIDGWQEVAFLIQTGSEEKTVYLQFELGSGSVYTPDTLAAGNVFVSNVTLVDSDYKDYSASTSNFRKKVSFVTTTSDTVSNGGFNNLDYEKVEGLATGGMVDGKLSENFGTPANWTLVNKNGNGKQLAGIVDVNNETLVQNIVADYADGTLLYEGLFGENMFINPNASGVTLDMLSYFGGDNVLMLASGDVKTSDADKNGQPASVGYTSSSSFSLSAEGYYLISVLVKTVGDSTASLYLYDTDNAVLAKFEGIKSGTANQGWTRYTFAAKTGISAKSVKLGLFLGTKDSYSGLSKPDESTEYSLLKGGVAFFDQASLVTIDKKAYNGLTENGELKVCSFTSDSFENFASSSVESSGLGKPDGWTGSSDYKETEEKPSTNTTAGVLIGNNADSFLDRLVALDGFTKLDGEPEENVEYFYQDGETWRIWKEGDFEDGRYKNEVIEKLAKDNNVSLADQLAAQYAKRAAYKAQFVESEPNSYLLINNEDATAYSFTSSKFTFSKNSYYKVSFSAKLLEASENAYLYVQINDTTAGVGDYVIKISASEWTGGTFYLKTSSSDASVTVKVGFGRVFTPANSSNVTYDYFSGFAMFDNIDIQKIEASEYNAATTNEAAHVLKDTLTDSKTIDKGSDSKDKDKTKNNLGWLWISSAVIGALIIAAVIVYLVKKVIPKRKALKNMPSYDARRAQSPDSLKKREDKYKNMKD